LFLTNIVFALFYKLINCIEAKAISPTKTFSDKDNQNKSKTLFNGELKELKKNPFNLKKTLFH